MSLISVSVQHTLHGLEKNPEALFTDSDSFPVACLLLPLT